VVDDEKKTEVFKSRMKFNVISKTGSTKNIIGIEINF